MLFCCNFNTILKIKTITGNEIPVGMDLNQKFIFSFTSK